MDLGRVGARLYLQGLVIDCASWTADLSTGLVILDDLAILGEWRPGDRLGAGVIRFDRRVSIDVKGVDVIAAEVVRCWAAPEAVALLRPKAVHSIAKHPLGDESDFKTICNDVQFCRTSWPIGLVIGEPIRGGAK